MTEEFKPLKPLAERLLHDLQRGEIRDGAIRYLMLRNDVLMNMLQRLPADIAVQTWLALGDAVRQYGGRSAALYAQAVGTEQLLDVIVRTAPQLGWGVWTFSQPRPDGIDLTVVNSPFVLPEIYPAATACQPIRGMLEAVASLAFDTDATAHEKQCAAQGEADSCRFEARWLRQTS